MFTCVGDDKKKNVPTIDQENNESVNDNLNIKIKT